MSAYALIKDGIVVNAVLWDGEGEIFQEFETYEIGEGEAVGPGFTAEKDQKGNWVFTAPVVVVTPEQQAQKNLNTAQSEYSLASSQITALNQRIEDEDYSDELTADIVSALKTSWTKYRKELRAYIEKSDGAVKLPSPPVNA